MCRRFDPGPDHSTKPWFPQRNRVFFVSSPPCGNAPIADIESGWQLCLPAPARAVQVGDVGRFAATVSVVQIIVGQNMTVRGTVTRERSSALAEFNGDGETDIRH